MVSRLKVWAVWGLAGGVFAPSSETLLCAEGVRAVQDAQADTPPKPLKQPLPQYPLAMRYSGYRGRVSLEFIIAKDGTPREPQVISSNHPAFEQAAMDAILNWRFEPGKKEGQPVAARVRQTLSFDLEPGFRSVNPFTAPSRASAETPEEFRYDVAPEVDLMVQPVYPRELAIADVAGSAEVKFVVDIAGRPALIQIEKASHPDFGASLAAAVEAWRFAPARKSGKPCPAILAYRHEFKRSDNAAGKRVLAVLRKDGEAGFAGLAQIDHKPSPLFRAPPVYPESLRAANREGAVTVRFVIDEEGVPRFPVAVDATDPALGWAAVTAVQRQRYSPAGKGGKPVAVWAMLPIRFSLAPAPADR